MAKPGAVVTPASPGHPVYLTSWLLAPSAFSGEDRLRGRSVQGDGAGIALQVALSAHLGERLEWGFLKTQAIELGA